MSIKFNPFAGSDSTGESGFFQMKKIAVSLGTIDKTIYKDAEEMVRGKRARLREGRFGYASSYYSDMLMGEFTAEFDDSMSFRFSFSRTELLMLECPSYKCQSEREGSRYCIHETAALIMLNDYIRENNPGDTTDRAAAGFLMLFRSENSASGIEKKPCVSLVPRMKTASAKDDSSPEIRLMITTTDVSRYYVVRDISDFVRSVYGEEIYPLGKKNRVDFSAQTFDPKSSELFKAVSEWVDDRNHRSEGVLRRFMGFERDLKESVELYGERVDRIFNLYEGETIMQENTSAPMEVVRNTPEITLTLSSYMENGSFMGVKLSGQIPPLYYGANGTYSIVGSRFMKLDDEAARMLKAFDESDSFAGYYGRSDEVVLTFGKRHMSELYHTILPVLRGRFTVIENDDAAEEYVPVEAVYKFYLDIADELPECRVEMLYGDKLLSIKDNLKSGYLKEEYRNAQQESAVLRSVMKYFPTSQKKFDTFSGSEDPDKLFEIIENGVSELLRYGEVVCTDRFQRIRSPKKIGISVGVSIESDLLNLEVMSSDISPKELLEIVKSYKAKKRYHRLKSGEFVNIDTSVEELSLMLDTMHISPKEFVKGKMKLPMYRALYLDKMLEQSGEIYAKRNSVYKKLIKNFKTISDSDFEIPDSLRRIMRGYQRYGCRWLRTIETCGFGGILADDMGLGKTLQTISVMLSAKEEGSCGTSLIVCPASLVYNWAEEFEKFAPSLNVLIVTGVQSEREQLIKKYDQYDAVITSYDLLKRDIDLYEDCRFNYQIIDEAQYIKNHNTAASKSVKLIKADHRFALTGTPIENRLSELWSIFDYLMPGFLYGYDTFRKEFETPIVKKSDEAAAKRLRRMISPFILRRLKSEVLKDLPEKLEEDHYVKFEEKQRHLYDAKVVELKALLDSESDESYNTNKLKVLAMLTQLRQICCDPSLLYENYSGGSAKLGACMEIIKSAVEGEHRMLIFSQFTSMLEIIEKALNDEGIEYYKITGETPKRKRAQLVDSFNSGTTPVFLISLKAGGTGLNLIGADIVIHYDPWWNAAAQNQATDRTHRIGQTKKVTVYKLLAKGTIEERIQKMQATKSELAESMLSGGNINLTSLSRQELMDLLGG